MSEAAANAGPVRRRHLPRPAPAMVIAAVAWGLLGAVASLGWLPAWVWTLAAFVLATLVLLDLALLLRADGAMYRIKHGTKNGFAVAPPAGSDS